MKKVTCLIFAPSLATHEQDLTCQHVPGHKKGYIWACHDMRSCLLTAARRAFGHGAKHRPGILKHSWRSSADRKLAQARDAQANDKRRYQHDHLT